MSGKCFERRKGDVTTRACRVDVATTRVDAYIGGARVGSLELYGDEGALVIGIVEVNKHLRRYGVGTALYEAVVDLGCRTKLAVRSDNMRSPFAEAFWRKQVTKGRAVCRGKGGEVYHEPSYRALSAEDKARLPQPVLDENGDARWACGRYEISAPCATKTLDGVRRRRRAKR